MTTQIKKITIRDVTGKDVIKGFKNGSIKEGVLMRVLGRVIAVEPKTTQYGVSYKLSGTFEATNVETGEVFGAGICYLPEVVSLPVAGAMSGEGNATDTLTFAVDIGIRASDKSPVGFEYVAHALVDKPESDPFAALRADLPPLLEAPVASKKKK